MGIPHCKDFCSNEVFLTRQVTTLLIIGTALVWGRIFQRLDNTMGAIKKINNISNDTLPIGHDVERTRYLNVQRKALAKDFAVIVVGIFLALLTRNCDLQNQDRYFDCLVDCNISFDAD